MKERRLSIAFEKNVFGIALNFQIHFTKD